MTLEFKEKKSKISITVNSLVHNGIKSLAKKDSRSLSNYIELVLKEHLEEKQKGKQKTIK